MVSNLNNLLSNTVFPRVLDMTAIASVVILVVILVRFLLRKAPKVFSYLLWSVVLFRLLCPISFSTNMSMFNLKLFDAPMIHELQNEVTHNEELNNTHKEVVNEVNTPDNLQPTNATTSTVITPPDAGNKLSIVSIATAVWSAGMVLLFVMNLVSLIKLKHKTAACLKIRDNIYIADEIDTPFCLGFVHPKIFLPSNLQDKEMAYIIIHEQTHIRRMDHIIKILAFVALIIHWFNPLVWIAFILASKDIEMSCDETVLRKMKGDIRQDYCMSILQLATRRRISLVSPLSFADGDPKRRIKNVMNYQKPRRGALALSMLICIVAGVGLSSNAKTKPDTITDSNTEVAVQDTTNLDATVQETTEDATTENATTVEATTENADSAMQEITDESVIKEYLHGFTLPAGMNISNVKYYLTGDTLELHFMYEDYTFMIARIAKAASYADISGASYPWTFETDELTVSDRPTHTTSYFSDTESVMLITWYEESKGVNVSLEAMGKDLNGFDIFTVAERMLPNN